MSQEIDSHSVVTDKPLAKEVTCVVGPLASHVRSESLTRGSSGSAASYGSQVGNGTLVGMPTSSIVRSRASGGAATASGSKLVRVRPSSTRANGGEGSTSGGPSAVSGTEIVPLSARSARKARAKGTERGKTGGRGAATGTSREHVGTSEGLSTSEQGANVAASTQSDAATEDIETPRRSRKGHACAFCGIKEGVKLQMCAGCEMVCYCGGECQRSHWALHKAECRGRQARGAR